MAAQPAQPVLTDKEQMQVAQRLRDLRRNEDNIVAKIAELENEEAEHK